MNEAFQASGPESLGDDASDPDTLEKELSGEELSGDESSEDEPSGEPTDDTPSDPLPEKQVRLKAADNHIDLLLPLEAENPNPDTPLELEDSDLWQQLQQRLSGSDRFWTPSMPVHLHAYNRLLDTRQLQAIADSLAGYDLKLSRVFTYRRQTAVAAVTAGYSVDQQAEPPKLLLQSVSPTPAAAAAPPLAEPLYLQTTVRSGTEINHRGTVIILGDLNPGSSVVADGDILVWGRLRGVAHAGAAGNRRCLILALQLQPTQLRIADAVARVPEAQPNAPVQPEVAYITHRSIRIAAASGFVRPSV